MSNEIVGKVCHHRACSKFFSNVGMTAPIYKLSYDSRIAIFWQLPEHCVVVFVLQLVTIVPEATKRITRNHKKRGQYGTTYDFWLSFCPEGPTFV